MNWHQTGEDLAAYIRWRPAFAEAMDPRFYTPEYLDRLIVEGAAFIWASDSAAIMAEVKTFPTGARVIHGLVAAGELDGIKELIGKAEMWARHRGCIGALIESRDGWGRALKAEGYRPFQQSIFKDFSA